MCPSPSINANVINLVQSQLSFPKNGNFCFSLNILDFFEESRNNPWILSWLQNQNRIIRFKIKNCSFQIYAQKIHKTCLTKKTSWPLAKYLVKLIGSIHWQGVKKDKYLSDWLSLKYFKIPKMNQNFENSKMGQLISLRNSSIIFSTP